MEATLVCTQVEGNPLNLPLKADTVEQLHEQGKHAIHAGTIAFMAVAQMMDANPTDVLNKMYASLGGQTINYTLMMDDGVEDGSCDVSPSALGQHHLTVLEAKPHLREVMSAHVNCGEHENCKIRLFYEALELPFPPA